MRILVTGVDDDGRSCAAFHDEPEFAANGAGFAFAHVFSTGDAPPPPRPGGRAPVVDTAIPAPGAVRWMLVEFGPGATTLNHQTDSVEFEVVLSGSITVTLDDGPHELHAGDCIAMTGVDHAWEAGPDGCRLSVVSVGTPPPD